MTVAVKCNAGVNAKCQVPIANCHVLGVANCQVPRANAKCNASVPSVMRTCQVCPGGEGIAPPPPSHAQHVCPKFVDLDTYVFDSTRILVCLDAKTSMLIHMRFVYSAATLV